MDSLFEIESEDQFRNVVEEVLNNLHISKSGISAENKMITLAKEELKQILSSNNYDLAKIKNYLQNKQWNSDRIKLFLSMVEENCSEILYNTLLNHNSMFGEAVVDFDWRLKIVLGTSELKTLRYPLLQLILTTSSSNCQRQNVYDIKKDMLKRLIEVLESSLEI
ncbi:uncharacterized protein LOC106129404 [Amyelois transitella]|uniref:uncharacterized protein LOC106129404 n=1 Tax=Amyelois transitella TaxID=680683 RepID=UPI00067C5692|nr:uncharacterized protein LOC106129404 [Amyelois transitella]